MISDAESIAEHIRFLKRRILGNEVVHHQTLPERPARLVRDLAGLPPAMARILEIARIPALYTHQAEGIQKVLEGQHLAIATPTASGKTLVYNAPCWPRCSTIQRHTRSTCFRSRRWSRISSTS